MTDLPPATTEHTAPEHDPTTAAVSDLRDAFGRVRTEVAKAVVGQEGAVSGMIVGLLRRGTCCSRASPVSRRPCSSAASPPR